jgi:hypothetical protein
MRTFPHRNPMEAFAMNHLTTPAPQIAVLDRGFVYVGACAVQDGVLVISNAQCIRRWGTTAGLGQLASAGPQPQTKLDPAGTIRAPLSAVIHLIDCAPTAWPALAQAA